MWHLVKYKFIQTVREGSVMFWALLFPIILGTFFYISFGSGDMGDEMEAIPVAVVKEGGDTNSTEAFLQFLDEMDGDTLLIHKMNSKKAKKALKADEVAGIYYVKEKPSMTVAKSEIEQSILKSILDSYNKNAALVEEVIESHPERIEQTMEAMGDFKEMTEEVSLGGKTQDPNIAYFFALIAYACLSGSFLGVKSTSDSLANVSPLGARQSVTPTHKLKLILVDAMVVIGIHYVNIMILTFYIQFVLGINVGEQAGNMLIVNLLGSTIGVAMGILIGSISKLTFGIKMGLTVTLTLFPGFLAGLMFGNMKDVIEHACPIVNRINPAAVLSDAYYCMGVYSDMERFTGNLLILGAMSVGCVLFAFLRVRRESYDSI